MSEEKLKKISNIMSVFALIAGILGIALCCNLGLGIISGIIAINLSICSLITRSKKNAFAYAGIVTGVIAIVFGIIYLIAVIIILYNWGFDIILFFEFLDSLFELIRFIHNLFH